MGANKLFFICGAHCTGKSSIINYLNDQGLISYVGDEIGKRLFYEKRINTENAEIEFDFRVTELELKRDFELIKINNGYKAIETWHPGNLAYAKVRNPAVCSDLIEQIRNSPFIHHAVGVWLRMPCELIFERTKTFKDSRVWAMDFYSKIDLAIESCLQSLELSERTCIIDASQPFDMVSKQVANYILRFIKSI